MTMENGPSKGEKEEAEPAADGWPWWGICGWKRLMLAPVWTSSTSLPRSRRTGMPLMKVKTLPNCWFAR
jgi:hypothetical protein